MAGKVFRLREWLTVPEAARQLSSLIDEPVSEADVLRLSLDGHLTLSVLFVNHGHGRCGPVVSKADARRFEFALSSLELKQFDADMGWFCGFHGLVIGDDEVFEPAKEVVSIEGVWDLPMLGAERLDVEHQFQLLTDGPPVDLVCLDGVLLRAGGMHCQLQAHFEDNEFHNPANLKKPWSHADNFYPAGSLPRDAVYVVRTSALRDLLGRLDAPDAKPQRPLERRERSTLLTIIAGLADLAKVDLARPSSAAAAIESATERLGARVAARTIENHLKRIPETLEDRGE